MRLFSSLTPAEQDAPTAAPVPEHLREHYDVADPAAAEIYKTARRLAESDARAALHDKTNTQGEQYAAEIAAEADRLFGQNMPAYSDQARHALKLDAAVRAHGVAQRRDAATTAHRALHTCPTCGAYDLRRNGPVKPRRLGDPDAANRAPVVSCWSCFNEANTQLRTARAADIVRDGQTRGDLIADLIKGGQIS